MVQFGQVFGVFRLFEEDNDLPMTQALDVPETPVRNQAVYKVNNLITTIPESPDVSDRVIIYILHKTYMFFNIKVNRKFIGTVGFKHRNRIITAIFLV